MSTHYFNHLCGASIHSPPSSSNVALKVYPPPTRLHGFKGLSQCYKTAKCIFNLKKHGKYEKSGPKVLRVMNMSAGEAGSPGKIKLDHIINKARHIWDNTPQPVKSFPWNRTLENFVQLILDLALAVIKYLYVPVLAVSSLSEMSYCAHEKKMTLIPIPLLVGAVFARALRETALELSPLLKDAEVPWHLIAIVIFFTLLKLPGPYYPYWGRIFIPHFANGGLLQTLWSMYIWYRRPQKSTRAESVNDNLPEQSAL